MNIHPQAGHHLASQSWDAHLQTLEGRQVVDRSLEPTAQLTARISSREALGSEIGEQGVHRFIAASLIEPGILLLGREPEWHGSAEGERGILAHVVVAGRMAAFHGAGLHGIQHFKSGNNFTGGKRFDREPSATHRLHLFTDGFGTSVNGVE